MFALLLLSLSLFIAIYSFQYPSKARIGPLLVAIFALALSLTQIFRESLVEKPAPIKEQVHSGRQGLVVNIKVRYGPHFEIGACLLGLIAAIYLVGFLGGCSLFLVTYLKLRRECWLISIFIAIVVPALMYAIFSIGLNFVFYKGILLE